jgi:hypothetical protein
VLDLPREYRVATVEEHMATFAAVLRQPRYDGSRDAARLSDRISDFALRAPRLSDEEPA